MRGIGKAEFYKLSRSRWMWFLALADMAYLAVLWIRSGLRLPDIVQFWAETEFFVSASVLAALYGMVIAQEYTSGYFKETVCAGYTRQHVYCARYFAFFVGITLILLLPYLLSFFIFFLSEGDNMAILVESGKTILSGLFFLLLYCICLSAFFMMAIVIMKSYAAVIFVCIFYNMALVFVHGIIPAEALPMWISYSVVGVQDKLLHVEKTADSIWMISALLGQTVLYSGIGYLFFAKRELR